METLDHIHVFKTNLGLVCPNCEVHKLLDALDEISDWNVDCEDVDCVLRVVSEKLRPTTIINIIKSFGYECAELQ
ncbi:hypothetical protein HUK80_16245 [Flavobacterium sp. MAH-1]|uniref:HMA domain-containing protein n=1 Tax=Flavobacterium agri TaxID=2743471 RepID=A0A7Y9C8K1_9FLAO|nr:hypothetical protein [Flavobacterium agri]NUY82458.1 hypothetical protein [Flavobacterium agri]NYA72482.1 hypothetical protein [Flavobacterium agri]